MALTADELITKAREQRGQNRLEEALVSALAAVRQDPESSDGWWQIALCRLALDDTTNAITALEKVVELDAEANIAWTRLGECYLAKGEIEDARYALVMAYDIDDNNVSTLEALSEMYYKENDEDQDDSEIEVLEKLFSINSLSNTQLNRLGTLFYKNKKYFEAARYWSFEIEEETDPARSFNLGLVYNTTVINRPLDAIDTWRIALHVWPSYQKLENILQTNAQKVFAEQQEIIRKIGFPCFPKDDWYSDYINPFTLINASRDSYSIVCDPKYILKGRKRLLQEVELEDGSISWVDGLVIDKSRAISLVDELNDDVKFENHWKVFEDVDLLNFLTTGSLDHFLIRKDNESRVPILGHLQYDHEFREWLSPIFAKQFDRVLSRAIQSSNLELVKLILSGRRWVEPSNVDECFVGARKALSALMVPLKELLAYSENKKKIKIDELVGKVEASGLLALLNMLPAYFEEEQREVVSAIRLIAINACNNDDDLSLANQALSIAKKFLFSPQSLKDRLEKDLKDIVEIDQRQRKHEVNLTMGKVPLKITKEGVIFGDKRIPVETVESIRWGIIIGAENGRRYHDFLYECTNSRTEILVTWRGVSDIDTQEKHFSNLVNASLSYLAGKILDHTIDLIKRGSSVVVGPCSLSSTGITFEDKGWIFSDTKQIAWYNAIFSMENGDIIITDRTNRKATVKFAVRETRNAFLPRALSIKMGATA